MPLHGKQPRIVREAFFAQVPAPDGTAPFTNITDHVGKPMPFTKPKATCAMQVTEVTEVPVEGSETETESVPAPGGNRGVVSFSLLHLTKKSAESVATKPITIPRGPLAMLARKAVTLAPDAPDEVVAEVVVEAGDEPSTYTRRLTLARDENGVASVDCDDDDVFELPRRALRATIFLRSPAVDRTLAVGFIGHLGRPGDQSSIVRVASRVLFSMAQLTEFRVLSKIETVHVPAPINRGAPRAIVRKADDRAYVEMPVRLFTATQELKASGTLVVEVDLENANPASGRLLFHYGPSETLAPEFEPYRMIVDSSVSGFLTEALGADDVSNITYDIVLGSVETSTVERLRDALETLAGGLAFTPTQVARLSAV